MTEISHSKIKSGLSKLTCLLLLFLLAACDSSIPTSTVIREPPVPKDPPQIFLTNDSGKTWEIVYTQPEHAVAMTSASCPTPTDCFVVNSNGRILLTNDSGKTWKEVTTLSTDSNANNQLSCPDPSNCYLMSYTVLFSSGDGGKSWKEITPKNIGKYSFVSISCPVKDTCLSVLSTGSILSTSDGGKNWSTPSLPPGKPSHISCPTANDCTAVGSFDETHGVIIQTSDGGKTWQNVSQDIVGIGIALDCPTAKVCYFLASDSSRDVFGGRSIIVTKDGGKSWNKIKPKGTNQYTDNISCANESTCFVTGFDNTTFVTIDGGGTWTERNPNVPSQIENLTCLSEITCLILTDIHL